MNSKFKTNNKPLSFGGKVNVVHLRVMKVYGGIEV
jgi:hypothetical protein